MWHASINTSTTWNIKTFFNSINVTLIFVWSHHKNTILPWWGRRARLGSTDWPAASSWSSQRWGISCSYGSWSGAKPWRSTAGAARTITSGEGIRICWTTAALVVCCLHIEPIFLPNISASSIRPDPYRGDTNYAATDCEPSLAVLVVRLIHHPLHRTLVLVSLHHSEYTCFGAHAQNHSRNRFISLPFTS